MTHANTSPEADLKDSAVAVKDAGHRISDARDSAAAVLDTVKSKAEDYNDTVVGFIRKNPYKSLAIAAGIGLAAGYLLRRR